jgi:hypothetical protein
MNNKERKIYKNLEKNQFERVGSINKNRNGSIMIVEKYGGTNDIWVRFETGNLEHTSFRHFRNGNVMNPFDKSFCGVGFLGKGEYKTFENGKYTLAFTTWSSMINRCYNEKFHQKQHSYEDCIVCEEWKNFQNYAKWFEKNYYEIDGEKMNLDKDILVKGNKVYSPETCVFVPMSINNLFVKSNAIRGKFPVGVIYNKKMKKYVARCKNGKGIQQTIGSYDNPSDAFYAYKHVKEKVIKSVANDLLDKIPNILYDALLRYKVEIDD